MNTHADKTQENKSQTVSTADSQMQSGGESTFQFVDNRPEAIAQRKLQEMANNSPQVSQLRVFQDMANKSPQAKRATQLQTMADSHSTHQQPIQKKENNTGLPDNLKTGMENLSGMSLDDVKVHRNSEKPAQLQAHAYAQDTDIHLGPGQEKHLPHEAWHVVQQKQGRVKPTMQMKGNVNVNDDASLENEADVMGSKALQMKTFDKEVQLGNNSSAAGVVQRKLTKVEDTEDLYYDDFLMENVKIEEKINDDLYIIEGQTYFLRWYYIPSTDDHTQVGAGLDLDVVPVAEMDVFETMKSTKGDNLIPLYRMCSKEEAAATETTQSAGGKVVHLTSMQASETSAVEQVANNEGIGGAAPADERLAKLQAILAAKGSKDKVNTAVKERDVVEYSPKLAAQFPGTAIKIMVNRKFVVKGSNLASENGYILQIGTPLGGATIVKAYNTK
jgi:hypothetical protein